MILNDSFVVKLIIRNGALLIIPPMVITFGLWSSLPTAYGPVQFWKEIPNWLTISENIFRIIVFVLPGFLYFGIKEKSQKLGWVLYIVGIIIYLGSYQMQILYSGSDWSRSLVGFTAPAWTTAFWFTGIGLVCHKSWTRISWNRIVYLGFALLFLVFHVGHTLIVFTHQ